MMNSKWYYDLVVNDTPTEMVTIVDCNGITMLPPIAKELGLYIMHLHNKALEV